MLLPIFIILLTGNHMRVLLVWTVKMKLTKKVITVVVMIVIFKWKTLIIQIQVCKCKT